MKNYPKIIKNNNNYEIILSNYDEKADRCSVEFILDFNGYHDLIGIEIINLKMQVGEYCLEEIKAVIASKEGSIRYSYDEDSDSFYLQLSDEQSIDQVVVDGELVLNSRGHIQSVKTPL